MGNQQKIITGTCILIKLRCRSTMFFWNWSDTTTAMHRVTQQTITDLICS